jgi:hypothetical protein
VKDPFKSDNYRENLDFLKEAIKAGDELVTIRHYNKMVRDLSQALKRFTDKAEDVAKFVIRSDSIDYVKLMNGKPSGLKILKEILNRISGRNVPVKNISSFIDKLPPPTSMTIFEYLEAYRKISGLEQVERGNIVIAPEKPERSFLKEDRQVEVNYNDSGHGNSLEPVHNLLRSKAVKARTTICKLVLSLRSQFFHNRLRFSNQAKERSTTHLFGNTAKVCNSLRFITSTVAPIVAFICVAKFSPV